MDFINQSGTVAKKHFQAHDLIEPEKELNGYQIKDLDNALLSYNRNVSSSLGKLVKIVWSDVTQYDTAMDSNAIRANVGKF